jgi:hypothetical protein
LRGLSGLIGIVRAGTTWQDIANLWLDKLRQQFFGKTNR